VHQNFWPDTREAVQNTLDINGIEETTLKWLELVRTISRPACLLKIPPNDANKILRVGQAASQRYAATKSPQPRAFRGSRSPPPTTLSDFVQVSQGFQNRLEDREQNLGKGVSFECPRRNRTDTKE
jgi:hypothetical protein